MSDARKEALVNLLDMKVFKQAEIARRVGRKGLSLSSLYNKKNPSHKHNFDEGDIEALEAEFRAIIAEITEQLDIMSSESEKMPEEATEE